MFNFPKKHWKSVMLAGIVAFLGCEALEWLLMGIKGFSGDRLLGAVLIPFPYLFAVIFGALKYKNAPRWLTITCTIAYLLILIGGLLLMIFFA